LLGTRKWEPDIYFGFSPALHLQCTWWVPTDYDYYLSGTVTGFQLMLDIYTLLGLLRGDHFIFSSSKASIFLDEFSPLITRNHEKTIESNWRFSIILEGTENVDLHDYDF
jgi:hypothetical protein